MLELVATAPPARLAPWVERLWIIKGRMSAGPTRIVPNGIVDVIFNLGGAIEILDGCPGLERAARVLRGGLVNGVKTRWVTVRSLGEVWHAGVHLKLAAARALLRLPMDELTDHVVDGEALLGRSYAECRDRLAECRSHPQTIACLVAWLEGLLVDEAPPRRLAGMVAELQREASSRQIDRVAAGAGVSPRHLGRVFAGAIGVAPKQLATMARFQRVTARLDGAAPPELAAVAQACGYYDQAHLTREFRRFAGMTPGEYRARRRPVPSHVAL